VKRHEHRRWSRGARTARDRDDGVERAPSVAWAVGELIGDLAKRDAFEATAPVGHGSAIVAVLA
jgi:hypothetical protein